MKTLIKTASIVGIFAVSGMAMAEKDQCPDHLSAEQIYDCIVEYGAGGEYKAQAQQESSVETQQSKEDASLAKSESK